MRFVLIGLLYGNGGIQNHTHWLAEGLTAKGHSIDVLTPRPVHDRLGGLPENPHYNIIEYGDAGHVLSLINKMKGEEIEAVVITGTGWKAMGLTLALRRVKRRIFFEVMSGEREGRLDPRSLVHFGFDDIVGQGRPVRETFRKTFGWKKPAEVIPALPEPLEVVAGIPQAEKLSPDPGRRLKLAYFGRLARHKGVDHLIENWDRLAVYAECLDIYGTGEEHDRLAAMIEDKGLSAQIALKGRYPSGQAYVDLLRSYDMTLLPTWGKEGAPLVLLESMACGVPFTANGVGGIPDYANQDCEITDGNLDQFLPLYEKLATRIIQGEADPVRLQQHYTTHFSYQTLVDRWEAYLTTGKVEDWAPTAGQPHEDAA
ncbi:glycosyltransferase family 4 protein [Parvularcula marina]|uniref:Glycosyltransferase n=1 Tax=Parvularcula marina TaxID=2292771 RepID=A0A371RGE1_9PROT|nr:glycosyltransferase family 4 protein [Parvularcula marina]RFB04501.1 glycosyltransferase [Parvularcula marina]